MATPRIEENFKKNSDKSYPIFLKKEPLSPNIASPNELDSEMTREVPSELFENTQYVPEEIWREATPSKAIDNTASTRDFPAIKKYISLEKNKEKTPSSAPSSISVALLPK